MIIHDIANYLVNLKKQDVKPDIYSVFDLPCENYVENRCPENIESEKLTILEILNAIGCRLKNLFGFVKINTTTETIDEGEAVVNVSGNVDNLNFNFKIPRGKDGAQGPKGEPGPANLLIITATASTSVHGEYSPDVAYNDALADIQANKAVMIKLENVQGRYYIPYSANATEILASAGTISGSNQSIELYTLKWTAQTNIITLTGTKKGCTADGGTTGQVLVKKSNESFDTEWVDPPPVVHLTDTADDSKTAADGWAASPAAVAEAESLARPDYTSHTALGTKGTFTITKPGFIQFGVTTGSIEASIFHRIKINGVTIDQGHTISRNYTYYWSSLFPVSPNDIVETIAEPEKLTSSTFFYNLRKS